LVEEAATNRLLGSYDPATLVDGDGDEAVTVAGSIGTDCHISITRTELTMLAVVAA
jgi:hypothetical protein